MRASILLVMAALLSSAGARADAIDGPPDDCPSGWTPESDHSGPYCSPPPPDDCPAGYVPRVDREQPYCEPPPATPCPAGTLWTSSGVDHGECARAPSCETQAQCERGTTCREVRLCVSEQFSGPRMYETVHGSCGEGDACEAEQRCLVTRVCDPNVQRVDPQGRALPFIVRSPRSGCGCGAIGGEATALAWPIALVLFAIRRRR
jgi:hypothetical protein